MACLAVQKDKAVWDVPDKMLFNSCIFPTLLQEVQHDHPLNKIKYITLDPDDKNIFAWVFSQPGHRYNLFALKSEKPVSKTVFFF